MSFGPSGGNSTNDAPIFPSVDTTDQDSSNSSDSRFLMQTFGFVSWYILLVLCCVVPTVYAYRRRRRHREEERQRQASGVTSVDPQAMMSWVLAGGDFTAFRNSGDLTEEEKRERGKQILIALEATSMVATEEDFVKTNVCEDSKSGHLECESGASIDAAESEQNSAKGSDLDQSSATPEITKERSTSVSEEDTSADEQQNDPTHNISDVENQLQQNPNDASTDHAVLDETIFFADDDHHQYSSVELHKHAPNGNRSVPIACAICLAPYVVGDTITHSPNPECRHAFHQDCLIPWLVKTKPRPLCPCCRQTFCEVDEIGRGGNASSDDSTSDGEDIFVPTLGF